MLQKIYSEKIFIGRHEEQEIFKNILTNLSEKWILNIFGEGGLGKTQLLHRFIKVINELNEKDDNYVVTNNLIDLYWTANQRQLGILKSIAEQIGSEKFRAFFDNLNKYKELIARTESTYQQQLMDQEKNTIEQFIVEFHQLSNKRIILIFDTAEIESNTILRFWNQTLPRFRNDKNNTLVVIAGRKPVKQFNEHEIKYIELSGFRKEEVEVYFKNEGYHFDQYFVESVARLSNGRPILIALTIDWVRFGNSPADLIKAKNHEDFKRFMVERVQQLHFPEDLAILTMAHFHRRIDESILSLLLQQSTSEITTLMQNLSRFSFIKYRPPFENYPRSCTLHDEMRKMVNQYVWPIADRIGGYRQKLNRKIIDYYDRKISETPENEQIQRQDLTLERLYYTLDGSLKQGFDYSDILFEQAFYKHDTHFMDAINRIIHEQYKRLPNDLKHIHNFNRAIAFHHREQFSEAIELLNNLNDDETCRNELKWKAHSRLVVLYTESGDPLKGIQYGIELEKKLIFEIRNFLPSSENNKQLAHFLGTLSNNMGYAYRNQNKLNRSVAYYEKALEYFVDVDGTTAEIARTRNNLGFVYHRLGHNEKALAQCEIALRIRRELDNPYEVGLSYNVLGIIYTDQLRVHEAIKCFERALEAFRKVESERGKAMVNLAYGRLKRQMGWYKEDFAREPLQDEYSNSYTMLNQAIDVFRFLSNTTYLIEALNEKGTLCRQMKDWNEAHRCYFESKELSNQIGDIFREIDNLQDLGILCLFMGDSERALKYSEEASQKALERGAFYLYARSQWTISEVLFKKEKYKQAFEAATNACINFLRPDSTVWGHTSAKKELVYSKFEHKATELILKLPNKELVKKYCDYMVKRWENEEIQGKRLKEGYPGFIEKIRAYERDYEILKRGVPTK